MSEERLLEPTAVAERLRRVPPSRALDRARAEAALAEHLRALDLGPRPVRWIEEGGEGAVAVAKRGFIAAWEILWKKGKPLSVGATTTAAFTQLHGRAGMGGLEGAAKKEERRAGWGVKRAARKAGKAAGIGVAASRHPELERACEDALNEKGIGRRTTMIQAATQTAETRTAAQDAELSREVSQGDAATQAAKAPSWLARAQAVHHAGKPAEALERMAQVYLPLVDAVEAGLWLYWITDDEVIAVAAPTAD